MKLRTSFFNIHVLKKNMLRFAPVWILFAVAEVMCVLSLGTSNQGVIARDLIYLMGPLAVVHCAYALIVGSCLFGDLFNSRLCNGLHAMPLKREAWLVTGIVSGFLFALIPAVIGGGAAAIVLKEYAYMALVWQVCGLLQYFFFFGLAVFSAMCAGTRLGMVAIYGIVNFLSVLIFLVASTIYQPMLYGVVFSDDCFSLFSPVVEMVSHTYLEGSYDKILGFTFLRWLPENWNYLWICSGAGAVFYLLSWPMYRRRHLETAGDFLSFQPVKILFMIAYTFGMGTFLYYFGELFGLDNRYLFLAVGMIVGYFTGWMLLERSVKIFTGKVLVGFVAFGVLFGGSLGLTMVDPLGVQTYIPAAKHIDSVSIYPTGNNYIYTMQRDYSGWYITDPAEIAQVQQIHGMMLNAPQDKPGDGVGIDVTYRLKNGMVVYRSYEVLAEDPLAEELSAFLSDVRAIFHTGDWEELVQNVEELQVSFYGADTDHLIENADQQQALLEAIRLDAEAGNMAQPNNLHSNKTAIAVINMCWWQQMAGGKGTRWESVRVFSECENTLALLETLQ